MSSPWTRGLAITGRVKKNFVLVVGDLVVTVVLCSYVHIPVVFAYFVWFRTVLIVTLLILEVSTLNFVVFFAFLQEYEVVDHHDMKYKFTRRSTVKFNV